MITKHQKCGALVSVIHLGKYLKRTQESFLKMDLLQCMESYMKVIVKSMVIHQIIYIVAYTIFSRITFSEIAFTDIRYECLLQRDRYFYYILSRIISIYVPGLSAVEQKKSSYM